MIHSTASHRHHCDPTVAASRRRDQDARLRRAATPAGCPPGLFPADERVIAGIRWLID